MSKTFEFETVSREDAVKALSANRARPRASRFSELLDPIRKLPKNKALRLMMEKNDVTNFRSFVFRNTNGDDFVVKSARDLATGKYHVFVFRADES